MRKTIYITFAAAFLLFSCAPKTAISRDYDFNNVKRIGILAFDSPPRGLQGAENMFAKYLIQNGFTVVERARIEQVLAEQNMSVTGYMSPETTKLIGKILGVDVLLMGEITSYIPAKTTLAMVETRNFQSTPVFSVQNAMGPDGKIIQTSVPVGRTVSSQRDVSPTEVTTSAQVGVIAKLVDVQTAEIVWIGTDTGSDYSSLSAVDTVARRLVKKLAKDIKRLQK
ncbi:MAG: CsgG/HfaB family protein [Elusimicrobium sp.]|jgi:curli biogenesis system outer membrane secretion channel CsgG|nr:CsgG/HfaB family protein [Elusimicrobium sp.]